MLVRPSAGPNACRLTVVGAALLSMVTFVLPAAAAVRYVGPAGNSSNSGDSPGSPWSLAEANASLAPGDVCYLLPGTYSTSIQPAQSGTAASRITYIGDLGDPGRVIVTSIAISQKWITVQGVRSTGSATLDYPAQYDSVTHCVVRGLNLHAAKNSMVARNRIAGDVRIMANGGRACFSGQNLDPGCFANSEYDTLRGNEIELGIMGPGARSFELRGFAKACLIDSNQIRGTFDRRGSSDPDGSIAFVTYNSHSITFRDNKWVFEATSSPPVNTVWNGLYLRDSTTNFLFERDTLLLGANSSHGVRGLLSASGSFPASNSSNRWNRCYYKTNSYFYAQDRFDRCTIENSVFASKSGNALWFGTFTNSTLRHNTFYSGGQSLRFEGPFSGTNEIRSNILYSVDAGPPGNDGAIAFFTSSATSGFSSNYNVYFSPSFSSSPGDRSLMWCCYTVSRPGSGTPWFGKSGQDGNSRYGSPLFVDSTFTTLDPRLRPGSWAIGAGEGGADAGPLPFAPGGADITPPARVTDLVVTQQTSSSVTLSWTAPDDEGSSGRADSYDLRWSTQPITAAGFATAMPVAVQPIPAPGGSPQTYVMINLTPRTTYYFALKARDAAGNWSAVSNAPSVTTDAADTTAPGSIQDLSTSP